MTTSEQQSEIRFAITNVNVFDGQSFHQDTVVIDGGKIAAVGTGTEVAHASVVDGKGKFLIPGLIDAHVHLRGEKVLEQLAAFGVTTALDMASVPLAELNSLRGRPGLPDFRSAGPPATSPGSIHSRLMPDLKDFLVSNPAEALQFVADRVSEGSDYIKVVADIPGPDQSTLNTLISAAREHGKLTVAHAATNAPFLMALEAQADVITHSPQDKALDSAAVARMVSDKRISVPTLTMMEAMSKKRGPPSDYAHARASVKAMYDAGVPILAGTDANSGTIVLVPHGESLHYELELLVGAGMSTLDVLRAATVLPAQYFGLEDRGVIGKGLRADLVLLSANPLEDIRASRSIERVWIGGIEFVRLLQRE